MSNWLNFLPICQQQICAAPPVLCVMCSTCSLPKCLEAEAHEVHLRWGELTRELEIAAVDPGSQHFLIFFVGQKEKTFPPQLPFICVSNTKKDLVVNGQPSPSLWGLHAKHQTTETCLREYREQRHLWGDLIQNICFRQIFWNCALLCYWCISHHESMHDAPQLFNCNIFRSHGARTSWNQHTLSLSALQRSDTAFVELEEAHCDWSAMALGKYYKKLMLDPKWIGGCGGCVIGTKMGNRDRMGSDFILVQELKERNLALLFLKRSHHAPWGPQTVTMAWRFSFSVDLLFSHNELIVRIVFLN